MKQKNVMWMIGERFYYTIRYVFPLLQKLDISCFVLYFKKQMAAPVFMSINDFIWYEFIKYLVNEF